MAQNPLNLALRFVLELLALVAMGYWGWTTAAGATRYLLAIGVPLLAAAAWGTFRVPDDPGKAPVAVPCWLRLLLELTFFGFATWGLWAARATTAAWLFGGITLLHYILSYGRLAWLLQQEGERQT